MHISIAAEFFSLLIDRNCRARSAAEKNRLRNDVVGLAAHGPGEVLGALLVSPYARVFSELLWDLRSGMRSCTCFHCCRDGCDDFHG
jgi:hypothetical protein